MSLSLQQTHGFCTHSHGSREDSLWGTGQGRTLSAQEEADAPRGSHDLKDSVDLDERGPALWSAADAGPCPGAHGLEEELSVRREQHSGPNVRGAQRVALSPHPAEQSCPGPQMEKLRLRRSEIHARSLES